MFNAPLQTDRQLVDRVKNGGRVHPRRQKGTVNVLDIPEEHRPARQKQSQSKGEKIHLYQNYRYKQHVPGEPGMAEQKHYGHGAQGEQHVDTRTANPRQGKNIFRHIYLLHQRRVPGDRPHGLAGRLGHEIEDRLPDDQVYRVILDREPKHVGKHQHHDPHDHQRI